MGYRLSVVIVNYNVRDYLISCLSSLYKEFPNNDLQVIVVDNASSEPAEMDVHKQFPWVVWIANLKNVGFSAANNQGAKLAEASSILFLNPDTEIRNGALTILLNEFDKNNNQILAAKLLNTDGSLQVSCWPFPKVSSIILESIYINYIFKINSYSREVFESDFHPDCASGAAMILDQTIWKRLNGFDENIFWSEDVDLCYRAKLFGVSVKYLSTALIVHHGGKSSLFDQRIPISNQLLSKAKYFKKHKNKFVWLIAMLFIFIQIITRMIFFSITSLFGGQRSRVKRQAYYFSFRRYFNYLFANLDAVA